MKGNDHIMSKDELEELLGVNFYETFKPYTEEELTEKGHISIKKLREMIANGSDISGIFSNVVDLNGHLFSCAIKRGYVLYNSETNQIPEWITKPLSYVGFFDNDDNFIKVQSINGLWSFADMDGNLIGDGKKWFDYVEDFEDGAALVTLNDMNTYIDLDGEYIGNMGYGWVGNLSDGWCLVELNGKYSYMDESLELVEGGELWFDSAQTFRDGFANVILDGKKYIIDDEFNFYDSETKEPLENPFENENADKIGKIFRECINIYLNRM